MMQEHSKTVIIVLIVALWEILDSVKFFYFPNGSAPHTEYVIKEKIGDCAHLDLRSSQ